MHLELGENTCQDLPRFSYSSTISGIKRKSTSSEDCMTCLNRQVASVAILQMSHHQPQCTIFHYGIFSTQVLCIDALLIPGTMHQDSFHSTSCKWHQIVSENSSETVGVTISDNTHERILHPNFSTSTANCYHTHA